MINKQHMQPLPHQIKPLQLLQEHNKFALFLDMGLGKTFITLHHWYHQQDNNLLIVCPAAVSNGWVVEAKKMGLKGIEVINFNNLKINAKQKAELLIDRVQKSEERTMFVISYQSSFRMGDGLFKLPSNSLTIVFDESQKVKEKMSKQGKYAVRLSNNFKNTILLSGTPMSKGYEDFYNQLKILKHPNPLIKNWKSFKENFLLIERMYSGNYSFDTVVGVKNKDKLINIINEKSMFMKLKDSGLILPPQIESEVYIDNTEDVIQAIKTKVYNSWKQTNTLSAMMSYMQMSSFFVYGEELNGDRKTELFPLNPKKQALYELLDQTQEKVIVFYNFEQEVEFIKEVAKKHNKSFSQFNSKEAAQILKKEPEVLAVQYLSGSEGLNLQNYNRIIYYSPTVQGALFLQSKKRIHRKGQNKTCFYHYLLVKNSIEEKIFEKIKKGEEFTKELFEKYLEKEK